MIPKLKKPDAPPTPTSAYDKAPLRARDDTATAYSSLVNTSSQGLTVKAKTSKKSLLGGT